VLPKAASVPPEPSGTWEAPVSAPLSPHISSHTGVPFLLRLPNDHSASRAAGHDHAHLPVPATGSDCQRDCAWGPAAVGAPGSVLSGAERLRAGAAAGQGRLGGAGPLHPQHEDPGPGARTHQGRNLTGVLPGCGAALGGTQQGRRSDLRHCYLLCSHVS